MNMSTWEWDTNSHEKETKHFDICTRKQSGGPVIRKLIPDLGRGPPFNHHPLTPPPLLFPRSSRRWISWHPSRENCFVLNVDGSRLIESGRAGAGGLIRKGDGSWVIGFSCFLGIADNNYAELMAVYHGLNLAMYNGCTHICCYSDSKTVIDLISKPINNHHSHASIVTYIKELTNLDWKVTFSHTLREGNASADFLAKLGSTSDIKMRIWNSPPEGIETLLLSDSRRTKGDCGSETETKPFDICTLKQTGGHVVLKAPLFKKNRVTNPNPLTPPQPSSSSADAVKKDDFGSETKTKPFDICIPKQSGGVVNLKPSLFAKNREKRKEMKQSSKEIVSLRDGMVLLKGYISITDQVKIVKKCRELGLGDNGGFYQPGYDDKATLHLKMMCLGRNWDPKHGYDDSAVPREIPLEFLTLVQSAMKDSHSLTDPSDNSKRISSNIPSISPNICIINYYDKNGRLGLHQDKDESKKSLDARLPVVSFSIGDSAEFLYGDDRDVAKAEKVVLESGDVLIFGGKARDIFHGVTTIIPETAPSSLLEETNFRKPGRLNLTFRQY